MMILLPKVEPASAVRKQRNVVVKANYTQLVSLRIHLLFTLGDQSVVAAPFYFSAKALTEVELRLMETSIALASRESVPGAVPAIVIARTGQIHLINTDLATSPQRIDELHDASQAYLEEWRATA